MEEKKESAPEDKESIQEDVKNELDVLLALSEIKGDQQKEIDVMEMYAEKGFYETFSRILDHTSDDSECRIYVKKEKARSSLISVNETKKKQKVLLAMDPETDYTVEIDDVVDHDLLEALQDLNADYTVEISDIEIDEEGIEREAVKYPNINEVEWADQLYSEQDFKKVELDESRLNNIVAGIDKKGIEKNANEYTSLISPYDEIEIDMDEFLDGVEIKKEKEFDLKHVPTVRVGGSFFEESNIDEELHYIQLENEIEAEPVNSFGKYKSVVPSLEELAAKEFDIVVDDDVLTVEDDFSDYEKNPTTGLRILPLEYLKEEKSNVVPIKKKGIGGWLKGAAAAAIIVGSGLIGYSTNQLLKPIEIKSIDITPKVVQISESENKSVNASNNYGVSEKLIVEVVNEKVSSVPVVEYNMPEKKIVVERKQVKNESKIEKVTKKLFKGFNKKVSKKNDSYVNRGHEIPEPVKIKYAFDMPARGTVNLGEPIHSRLPALSGVRYAQKDDTIEPSVEYKWTGGQPKMGKNLSEEKRCRMMAGGYNESERSPSGLLKRVASIGKKHIAKYCSNLGKPAPNQENAKEPSVVYNWDGPAKKGVFNNFFREAGRMDLIK